MQLFVIYCHTSIEKTEDIYDVVIRVNIANKE